MKATCSRPHALLTVPFIVFLAAPDVGAAEVAATDGVEIARLLGFDRDALERVMAGELIARGSTETTDKELALIVWGWTRQSVPALFELLRAEDVLGVDRSVTSYFEIDVHDVAGSFASFSLDTRSIEELRGATRDGPLNLSHAELRAISSARAEPGAVTRVYREILVERTAAYLAGGVDAIAPYARGRSAVEPGDELRSATEGYRVLKSRIPAFHRAWAEFPQGAGAWELANRFFWILQSVDGEPTVVLSHTMLGMRDGLAIASERQFYVGRSYNVSETVWGGLPAETGSFVYYHNRTSTDQIAGLGGAVKKSIGRRIMQNEVLGFLESLRAAFE